jgi:serine/threonine protein kinase
MAYCIKPGCSDPDRNPDGAIVCQCCGSPLYLQDRYRAIAPLGQGGMGRTFVAIDSQRPSQPQCVIKQLYLPQADPAQLQKAVELFEREALRLDTLGVHPQIPQLLAHFEQDRQLYLVQEFIEGLPLDRELQQQKFYSAAEICQLLRDLLPVLSFIHDRNIIHRDLKPANLIRRGDGQLMLIDFGIAKTISTVTVMQTGTIVGTPEYMPPEQIRGKVVPASDLYSLGVTCIELLTGVSPRQLFDADEDRWIWRQFLPPQNPVGDRLGALLDRLLQNAPKRRYPSAAAVLHDLDRATVRPVPSPPVPTPVIAPRKPSLIQAIWRWLTGAPSPTDGDRLDSAVGVDYTRLRDLLAKQQWQEADRETRVLLCQVVGKPPLGYLDANDWQKFPCPDLKTLDRLWVKYSGGRFGFSVQARIFYTLGEDYGKFCDRVGWQSYNSVRPYTGVDFSRTARVGHLPYRTWASGIHWWRHLSALCDRWYRCEGGWEPGMGSGEWEVGSRE